MPTVFSLAGCVVFGLIVVRDGHMRVRMMTREWETLCLAEGQTIHMVCAGRLDSNLLIGSVTAGEPGCTWVNFVLPIRSRTAE